MTMKNLPHILKINVKKKIYINVITEISVEKNGFSHSVCIFK